MTKKNTKQMTDTDYDREMAEFRAEWDAYEDSDPYISAQKKEFFNSYQNAVQAVWDRR